MNRFKNFKFKKQHLIFLIIIVAVFFRFFQIGSVPPGLYPDVAVNGTDAIDANQTLNYQIFYPANNGREGLFINFIALSFKILGIGLWQLRLVGAIIGVLTVWGIYLLTNELLGENTALFASVFAASSFWAVNFSRIGFRAIMVPFILVFTLYFLHKGFTKEKKKTTNYVLAAIFFGLGFYTYISFKIAPLLLFILLFYTFFKEREIFRKNFKYLILFAAISLIIVFPILSFEFNSKDAAVRTGQVSIFNSAVNHGNFLGTLIKTTSLSLGMFNFYGDPNWRHNLSGLPDLNIIVGILFLIGIAISLKKFFKGDLAEKFTSLLLGSWLLVMLIPAILTEEGMPHSLRAIGSMVPAFIFAGIGANALFNYLSKKKNIKLAKNVIIGLVALVLVSDFILYFIIWVGRQEVIDQFTTKYVEEANYLNKIPDSFHKYVIANEGGVLISGFPVQTQTIKFLTYGKSQVIFINPPDIERLNIPKQTFFIALKDDESIKNLLEKRGKVIESYVSTANKSTNFKVYFVE